jgi:hypothetical protein
MFVPNSTQLGEFDLNKAKQFVDYWVKVYSYASVKCFNTEKNIDYIEELNIGARLTENNIKRLLRWKDPRMLTEKILSGPNKGKENIKVLKVLKRRDLINKFREGNIEVEEFRTVTEEIFPNGFVWQIFLFHIARPFEFPIADRNVFQSFSVQTKTIIPRNWEGYKNYITYFFRIAIAANIITEKPRGDELNLKEILRELKRVDNALFIFGQFLNSYGRTSRIQGN